MIDCGLFALLQSDEARGAALEMYKRLGYLTDGDKFLISVVKVHD